MKDETYQIKAIVLKREAFREADTRVVVYSREHGRLELIARGTKKLKSKLAGHLEPITIANIMVVRGRQFDYVGSAVSEDIFSGIKGDYEKAEAAGKAFSFLLGTIKEGIDDEIIFDLLYDFLARLENGRGQGMLPDFFILKLMDRLGYRPELRSCVSCHQKIGPKGNRFSFRKGGLTCPGCNPGNSATESAITEDAIKVLRLVLENDFANLAKLKINAILKTELERLIGSFVKYVMDK